MPRKAKQLSEEDRKEAERIAGGWRAQHENRRAATEIQKEIARRELARRRLIHFTKRFHPAYEAGWVHEDICRRLEKFFREVEEGKSPRLMLFMPPRHGKSELASINFPAWVLGHRPDFEIISSSYAVSLPTGFSRKVRGKIDDPAYKAIFPDTKLDPKSQSAEAWLTLSGGGYVAAGVGGGITGKGAHIAIIDDPIKDAEEADSETIREKVWDWYGSTLYTRLAPGGGLLVIQTRWHDDDLSGRLLLQQKELREAGVPEDEIDQWEVVSYPAIATEDEYIGPDGDILYRDGDGETFRTRTGQVVDFAKAKAKLLREKGDALHPERFDAGKLTRIKRTLQPRHWSALYQQNPVPDEGIYFTKTMFRTSPTPNLQDLDIYIAWDLAIGENQGNDWTVGVVGGLDWDDQLHIVDVIRFKGDTYAIAEAILNTAVKYQPMMVGAEKGQIELAIMPVLRKMMRKKRQYITFAEGQDALVPITDKAKRAKPLQGRMQQGMVYFAHGASWYENLMFELLRFPGGLHNDQVDAMAWLARMVLSAEPPRPPKSRQHKSWRDKLKGLTRGQKHPMAA